MRTVVFRNLEDDQILEMIDPAIPYVFIPNFRPHPAREWWKTDIHLEGSKALKNVDTRDLTVDIVTDKSNVEQIFESRKFNQISLLQFNKRMPHTLKIEEIPVDKVESILIQNGLVNKIWINYEFVELSSIDETYLETIETRFKGHLI